MSAIPYQKCMACGEQWVLPRPLCRACGASKIAPCESSGKGTVFSVTTQHRAPHQNYPETAPWRIALVDLDEEGLRVMGHLDEIGQIGDRVTGRIMIFAGTSVPTFTTQKEK